MDVVALEGLFPFLDVAIMATLSAWFLAFTTTRRAERATSRMVVCAERVRIGALAIAGGMALDVVSVAVELTAGPEAAVPVAFFAYPLWIGGAVALASATWAARRTVPDRTEVRA